MSSVYRSIGDFDRTIFVEYFPWGILTSIWTNSGKLESYDVKSHYA